MSGIGRRIAFDFGDVRIGVAVCDPDGILASPLKTLQSKDPNIKKQIAQLVAEYKPAKFYVGQPKLLSGQEGAAVLKVRTFTQMLTANFDIPVVLVDERLSTVSAARQLREAGINAKKARSVIDSAAAVAILEQGLANEPK